MPTVQILVASGANVDVAWSDMPAAEKGHALTTLRESDTSRPWCLVTKAEQCMHAMAVSSSERIKLEAYGETQAEHPHSVHLPREF
jgi:hypothetical protein